MLSLIGNIFCALIMIFLFFCLIFASCGDASITSFYISLVSAVILVGLLLLLFYIKSKVYLIVFVIFFGGPLIYTILSVIYKSSNK